MGIKPEVIVAPQAFAELAQKVATFQKAFAMSPAMQNFIKESQAFAEKIKMIYEKSGLAKLTKQFKNTFAKVKTWVKKIFVKYILPQIPLAEIPRAQIQPSTVKVLQLPNSFRSHSPPLRSVIV
jgi:pantoate kinase